MIGLLEKKLLTVNNKEILELGTGYIETVHYDIAERNKLTLLDIVPIDCGHADSTLPFDIIQADACATNIRSGNFDIAVSSMLIQHVDADAHFREVRRILRKGGLYWFACTGEGHNQELDYPDRFVLNVSADQFVNHGAKLIEEEKYKVLYNANELNRYARSLMRLQTGIGSRSGRFSLTKHYCLFEMQN